MIVAAAHLRAGDVLRREVRRDDIATLLTFQRGYVNCAISRVNVPRRSRRSRVEVFVRGGVFVANPASLYEVERHL